MSWRRLRGFWAAPLVEPGAAIVTQALRRAAEDYAAALSIGDEIVEETDGPEIEPFRSLLPGALSRRGLCLAQTTRGWVIERSPFPSLPPSPAECSVCHGSWFSAECGHGVGLVIEIKWGAS